MITIAKFSINGSFTQKSQETEFEMTLYPFIPMGEDAEKKKYQWLDNAEQMLMLPAEAIEELNTIQEKNKSKCLYYGEGKDPLGEFTVLAYVHRKNDLLDDDDSRMDGNIVFYKKYDNEKPHHYIIAYIGTFTEENVATGKWYLIHAKGNFSINWKD